MKSARIISAVLFLLAFAFNEWAFRFIFPLEPIDSFLRLMTLVLDGFVLVAVMALGWKNEKFTTRAKEIANSFPRSISIYFGLFVAYCCVMAVEFGCRYYFKHGYRAPYTEATYWEPSAVVPDSVLGSALLKDSVISHAYVVNDSLIYKQYYHTDEFGRRISPPTHPDSTYRDFVMVTGCSFAFGYGLNDHQTLSYFLDSLSDMRGYNYGVYGYGTQQTLALLQSRNLHREISEPNGTLIHLFIDDHIARLIGSRRLIKLWAIKYPYYRLEDGKPVRHGSFWTGRHFLTRLYRAISQSAIIDLFDIDIPWYVSDGHLKLFASVLKESQSEFKKQYPDGNFLVVIGPGSKYGKRAVAALVEANVPVLDLSELIDPKTKRYQIHWTEGHPNANYYRELADTITKALPPAPYAH